MLHTETIDKPTLELLISLQAKDYLRGFCLVGGTALALYFGHRKSLDLDLFSNFGFDAEMLLENIHQDFNFQLYHSASNTLKGHIHQINVDIIAHRYPMVDKPLSTDQITLLSVKDIVAMKLNAISVSGQRSKDFIDIFYALRIYPLKDMLDFYRHKYSQEDDTHVLKSLIFFDDVDLSDWPVLLQEPDLRWKEIRDKLKTEVLRYIKKSQ